MTLAARADLRFVRLPGRRSADPLTGLGAASSVRVVELEHTPARRAHRHPRCEEVMYVAAGQGAVWIDGAVSPVAAGDVVHVPAGAAHATVPAPGTAMRLVCFFPDPELASNTVETDLVADVVGADVRPDPATTTGPTATTDDEDLHR